MIQQQIIKNIKDRLVYVKKTGKFKKDNAEYMGKVCSSNWNEKVFLSLDQKPVVASSSKIREKYKERQYRACREIIVPIPHCLKGDMISQMNFINDYMAELKAKYSLGDNFVWAGFIHNKLADKENFPRSKDNFHAHILFSERELLDKPIKKHYQKRYFDENLKVCNKSKALVLDDNTLLYSPAHDKTLYFSEKKIQRNNEYVFHSQSFCYDCDQIWKNLVLAKNIMNQQELDKMFIPNSKARHIGPAEKANHLDKVWTQRVKDKSFNNELKEPKKEKSKGFEFGI